MFNLSEDSHPEIAVLLEHFLKTTYRASSPNEFNKVILNNAVDLLNRDFAYVNINNSNGCFCDSYPEVLPFLINELIAVNNSKLSELLMKCRRARCRNRFVVPVIKIGNSLLCRSATLSASVEMIYRNGWDYVFGARNDSDVPVSSSNIVPGRDSFDNIRGADIQLLRFLGINHIVDLMLENQKYKYGVKVTSSEKVDKEGRYSSFELVCLPFPGVEHFADWVDGGYVESGLRFDWRQNFITAEMKIPHSVSGKIQLQPNLSSWSNQYQGWETIQLTKSYLKLILKLLTEESSGILLHCISGWDRTPLFVSLVRISLWADGAIHQSLNAAEMLYFTIAYDWFLFSHNLVDRGKNRQEIFRYCFAVLKYIEGEEFSISNFHSEVDNGLQVLQYCEESDVNDNPKETAFSRRRNRLIVIRTFFENSYALAQAQLSSVVDTYQSMNYGSSESSQPPVSLDLTSLSRWINNMSARNNSNS